MFELFTIHLKQDISIYCQEKYGLVQVAFDSLVPLDENAASVQFAVNDPAGGFITRHYGTAHLHRWSLASQNQDHLICTRTNGWSIKRASELYGPGALLPLIDNQIRNRDLWAWRQQPLTMNGKAPCVGRDPEEASWISLRGEENMTVESDACISDHGRSDSF